MRITLNKICTVEGSRRVEKREMIRSTLEECSIVDWHGKIETRRRSEKQERKGVEEKEKEEDEEEEKKKQKKKKRRVKKQGKEWEKEREGGRPSGGERTIMWSQEDALFLFTRLTKLVYTETGTGRWERSLRTSTADLIGFIKELPSSSPSLLLSLFLSFFRFYFFSFPASID